MQIKHLLLVLLTAFSVCAQSPVKLWTGYHQVQSPYVSPTATSVDFLPDGRILSAGYNGLVKLWDTNGNSTVIYEAEYVYGLRNEINSISTDGNIVSIGQQNGWVRVLNGSDWFLGATVLKVSANNGRTAASGNRREVFVDGNFVAQAGDNTRIFGVVLKDDRLVFGGTDWMVWSSWQPEVFFGSDILDIDYDGNRTAVVGMNQFLMVDGQVRFSFPEQGNSSVHINRVNGKILVANWKPAIYIFNPDYSVNKLFNDEVNLIRCVKWSPDGNKFAYATADGRVVYALPEYAPTTTSPTNSTTIPKKGKGRR